MADCEIISCAVVLHDLYVDLLIRTKPDKYHALSVENTIKPLLV